MRRIAHQRGVVALELPAVMLIMILMLAYTLFLGRVFYSYQVAQRAMHDVALFMATVPLIDIKSASLAADDAAFASAIAASELTDLDSGVVPTSVNLSCDFLSCSAGTVPGTVTAAVQISVFDDLFPGYTGLWTGDTGFSVVVISRMRYVGR